jgi:hypothetical protein
MSNNKWLDKIAKEPKKEPVMPKGRKDSAMNQMIRNNLDRVYKVTGVDVTGRNAWYFVLIENTKRNLFLARKPSDSYNLEDYGQIITSGYGEQVPIEVQELLRDKYNFTNF